jgi:hypothetical protein
MMNVVTLDYRMCGKDRAAQTIGERSQYTVDHLHIALHTTLTA